MVSFSVAFFFCFLIWAHSWASRASSTTNDAEATAKGKGAFFLASPRGLSSVATGASVVLVATSALGVSLVLAAVLALGTSASSAAFAQSSTFAPSDGGGDFGVDAGVNAGGNLGVDAGVNAGGNLGVNAGGNGRTASRRFDPLRRDALGVQTRYPAVAKIVGRDAPQTREDGSQTIPLYYGTGTFVAEAGEWGIVVTNWHVVSESRDSIVAKFPTFSSPARAILRDETWDLAALVVRKPPRVAPIPISQETPDVGDALWVAGYGESAGLTEFQIQGGRVQNYALLVTDDAERENVAVSNERETVGQNGQNRRNGQGERTPTNGAVSASAAKALTLTPESALLYETLAVDK
ncbi:MAG: trypsin-like peptidase domain-containing protein, partial [Thermoguttaceae bacterium]|nr:trypsin-like peptidase domain-containing protein [Thermoguttaceae bacterium]